MKVVQFSAWLWLSQLFSARVETFSHERYFPRREQEVLLQAEIVDRVDPAASNTLSLPGGNIRREAEKICT